MHAEVSTGEKAPAVFAHCWGKSREEIAPTEPVALGTTCGSMGVPTAAPAQKDTCASPQVHEHRNCK